MPPRESLGSSRFYPNLETSPRTFLQVPPTPKPRLHPIHSLSSQENVLALQLSDRDVSTCVGWFHVAAHYQGPCDIFWVRQWLWIEPCSLQSRTGTLSENASDCIDKGIGIREREKIFEDYLLRGRSFWSEKACSVHKPTLLTSVFPIVFFLLLHAAGGLHRFES